MALSWPPGCLLAAQTIALSGCHGDPVHPSNSVLLSTTHPPFCSVSRCLSGVPEVDARGAPLPLTALLTAASQPADPGDGFYVGVARILNAYVPFLAETYPPI